MTPHEFEIYVELYKRGEYKNIPIGQFPDGEYFYMTDKQIKVLELINDDSTTDIGYGGSARSGKTIIECTAIIFDCHTYPDIAWGLSRKELTTLKRTVLLTMFKQLDFYGIKDYKIKKTAKFTFNYNHELNKITFTNKSDIFLIDTAYKPSDPLNTRFGGFELTRSAIDQSEETELSVVYKLFERTGWRNNDKYGLKRKQFECFNPAKNHVYNRYFKPYRDKVEDEHKKFIPALPKDNPHPSVKEWINDMLKTGDQVTIQRQIHGNFDYDDDPSVLCDYDAICDLFTNTHVKDGEKRISADLAMQGRDRFIAGSFNGLRVNVAINKPKSDGKDIENSLTELKNRTSTPNTKIVADSDGLGAYLESYIKNIVTFHGGAKAKNKEYYNLKSQCAFKLAEKINASEIYIECTKEEEEIIKTEIATCLKRDKIDDDIIKYRLISKDKMKQSLGHSPDFLDMLIMGMYFEIKPERKAFW